MTRLTILFAADYRPTPPDHGSSVISYHWMKGLAKGHRVVYLPLESAHDPAELARAGVESLPPVAAWQAPSTLRWATTRTPHAFTRLHATLAREAIKGAARRCGADAVVLVGPALAALLEAGPLDLPVVFVPYDSVAAVLANRSPGSSLRDVVTRVMEVPRWRSVEAVVYREASRVVFVTPEDAERVAATWPATERARVEVVPNGVDLVRWAPAAVAPEPRTLVATGNFGSGESLRAVSWLVRDVLPRVRLDVPDVRVTLAGRDPSREVRAIAAAGGGVTVTGTVPDLRPFLARGAVAICPMVAGSGIRNRMLESLAMGRPCVSTGLGVRGIGVKHGAEALVADDPRDFAAAVSELLLDPDRAERLGEAARAFAERELSWERATVRAEEVIARAIKGGVRQ